MYSEKETIYINNNHIMKHLVKNIAVLWFSILFILLSIKSSYAAEDYTLKNIEATSTKTIELELDKSINKSFTQSDLEIYKSIENKSSKIETEEKKVLLELSSNIEKNTSYSLISISSIEWNIIFRTWDDILLKEIQNNNLEPGEEGIKSILIKDSKTLLLTFTQNVDGADLEFQLLKTLEVEKVRTISETSKIKATLKWEMLNNEQYLGTLTFLQTNSGDKIEISKWINYFTTGELAKYEWPTAEELAAETELSDTISLEESLMNALKNSEWLNWDELSDSEKELKEELNSASEDPENNEKTQLEKLALSQKHTPDTGAETWVILIATFIINTFYYYSRRKKVVLA